MKIIDNVNSTKIRIKNSAFSERYVIETDDYYIWKFTNIDDSLKQKISFRIIKLIKHD